MVVGPGIRAQRSPPRLGSETVCLHMTMTLQIKYLNLFFRILFGSSLLRTATDMFHFTLLSCQVDQDFNGEAKLVEE